MKFVAAALLSLFAAASSHAGVTVTNTTQYNQGYAVSNTDLLQQHLSSSSYTGNFTAENTLGTVLSPTASTAARVTRATAARLPPAWAATSRPICSTPPTI